MGKNVKEPTTETYQGKCLYCGQTMLIEASNQTEADVGACLRCVCEEGETFRASHKCEDNIDRICGEEASHFGMAPVDVDVVELIKSLGQHCVVGYIDATTIRLADSIIAIRKTKDGVSVSRKKTSILKLET